MAGISFEITEEIAILSEKSSGWNKELNLVSWNNRDPKYDIREWDSEHEKMGKGITLSGEEARELYKALESIFGTSCSKTAKSGTLTDEDLALFKD